MFKRYYIMILFLIFTNVLLFGCVKPPTEEMIKAEKAIDEARQLEADIFANDIFTRAEESFQTAKKSVAERKYEEARPFFFRNKVENRKIIAHKTPGICAIFRTFRKLKLRLNIGYNLNVNCFSIRRQS